MSSGLSLELRLNSPNSDSSGFVLKTPNFFDSNPSSRSLMSSRTDFDRSSSAVGSVDSSVLSVSREAGGPYHTVEDQLAFSCILNSVKAHVDVGLENASSLKTKLRELGATVCLKFTRTVTHLVFWNGHQEVLDRAHRMKNRPIIVSPHWVESCYQQRKRVPENSYLLYGLTDLAVPIREMAMGRVGTIRREKRRRRRLKEKRGRQRTELVTSSSDSFTRSSETQSLSPFQKKRGTSKSSSPTQAELMYEIEALSDELASKIASPESAESVDVVEIISPIIDRVKRRVYEITHPDSNVTRRKQRSSNVRSSESADFRTPTNVCNWSSQLSAFVSSPLDSNVLAESPDDEDVDQQSQPKEQRLRFLDDLMSSASGTGGVRANLRGTGEANTRSAGDTTVEEISPTSQMSDALKSVQLTDTSRPAGQRNSKGGGMVNVSQSAPAKRRGRPPIPVAAMSPSQFERRLMRKCRSVEMRKLMKISTTEVVRMYRGMVEGFEAQPARNDNETPVSTEPKIRAYAVRTHSKFLNDLQNMPSSDEFVRRANKKKKPRRTGNIVLSGITKIERETIHAIVRNLGLLTITNYVDTKTRAVVGDTDGSRTVCVMHALVSGIPVVSIEWAYRSLEAGCWLQPAPFIIPKWKVAFKARLKGRRSLIFSSVGYFFVSSSCSPPADDLIVLIRSCGGKISESVDRSLIIVAPPVQWASLLKRRRPDSDKAHTVSEKWILDCIVLNELLPFEGRSSNSAL